MKRSVLATALALGAVQSLTRPMPLRRGRAS